MKRPTKVYCLFEQSGTFKREFIKLGIPSEDYDIQNNFGETDHVIDLFHEIEEAYRGGASVFDDITPDDLIMAFFPCIYFCEKSQWAFTFANPNYRMLTEVQKIEKILERENNRHYFYSILLKLVGVCERRDIRIIIENPYTQPHFLTNNFALPPALIDKDRSRRGDTRKKPTQYFYFNCVPTYGESYQQTPQCKILSHNNLKGGEHAGLCSEERSMISSDYARNFICDFILGEPSGKVPQQGDMFDAIIKGEMK